MSKPVKDLITKEYRRLYSEVDSACVVSVIGLDAISTNKLRGELHEKGICLRVVKNSLARRAFADSVLEPLSSALDGPCALVTGGDSAIDLAKLLVDIRKSYPQIELKSGILGGDPELIEVDQLAKMKNKTELLAELAFFVAELAFAVALVREVLDRLRVSLLQLKQAIDERGPFGLRLRRRQGRHLIVLEGLHAPGSVARESGAAGDGYRQGQDDGCCVSHHGTSLLRLSERFRASGVGSSGPSPDAPAGHRQ